MRRGGLPWVWTSCVPPHPHGSCSHPRLCAPAQAWVACLQHVTHARPNGRHGHPIAPARTQWQVATG